MATRQCRGLRDQGAWHHVTNGGQEGRPVFPTETEKTLFIRILLKTCRDDGLRLVAYCVLDDRFHLVLQNTSGRLSEAMKRLESTWATEHRRLHGGGGYVFPGRLKSTLVEEGDPLRVVVAYVLLDPVRAGLVEDASQYPFSSLRHHIAGDAPEVDTAFVEDLFGSAAGLLVALGASVVLPEPRQTRIGPVLGSERFAE